MTVFTISKKYALSHPRHRKWSAYRAFDLSCSETRLTRQASRNGKPPQIMQVKSKLRR